MGVTNDAMSFAIFVGIHRRVALSRLFRRSPQDDTRLPMYGCACARRRRPTPRSGSCRRALPLTSKAAV